MTGVTIMWHDCGEEYLITKERENKNIQGTCRTTRERKKERIIQKHTQNAKIGTSVLHIKL